MPEEARMRCDQISSFCDQIPPKSGHMKLSQFGHKFVKDEERRPGNHPTVGAEFVRENEARENFFWTNSAKYSFGRICINSGNFLGKDSWIRRRFGTGHRRRQQKSSAGKEGT